MRRGVTVRLLVDQLGSQKYPGWRQFGRRLTEIGVEWPIEPVILSDKDVKAPTLKERVATSLNFVYEG